MADVPLPEHLEALRLAEQRATDLARDEHQRVHAAEAEARGETKRVLETRLEQLNELRSEVTRDRSEFIRQEVYRAEHEATNNKLSDHAARLSTLEGRLLGASAIIVLLFGAVSALQYFVSR